MIRLQYFLYEMFEKRLLLNGFIITVDLRQFRFEGVLVV